MIIIDEKRIQLDRKYKGDDKLLLAIANKLKEIDRWFETQPTVKLKWAPQHRRANPISGRWETKGDSSIRFKQTTKIGGQAQEVIYAEAVQKVGDDYNYSPLNEFFTGTMIFAETDTEKLLWYLLFEPRMNKDIIREDIELEASKIADNRKSYVELDYFLYSDSSPLFDDRNTLEIIARNFAINTDKCHNIDMLKNKIRDIVTTEEGRKPGSALNQFKQYTKGLSDEVLAISTVSKGIIKKKIYFDKNSCEWRWSDDNSKIVAININDRGDDMKIRKQLAQFLMASDNLFILRNALNEADDEKSEITNDELVFDERTDWDNVPYSKLKMALSQKGVPALPTYKKPDLIRLCKETYKMTE